MPFNSSSILSHSSKTFALQRSNDHICVVVTMNVSTLSRKGDMCPIFNRTLKLKL